ncbi:MAG: NAD(P)H-dependent oxidoreductase [bacterium]|nr:NAD(P)H-dependent oxidoreductase [bacterium]
MNEKINILGINGSPHKEGHGVRLLTEALAHSEKEGAETKITHLVDHPMNFFPGEYSAETPKGCDEIFGLLEWADGVIFSSPVYWFSMSALMKNFIEHITTLEECRNFELEGKVAGFIATCEEDGGQKVISDMAAPLIHMGFVIPPYTMLFHNKHMAEKSEKGWQQDDHKLVGRNVARMAKILKDTSVVWGY